MNRSLAAVLAGTLTLRFSSSLTGTMLIYYLAELPKHGGMTVTPIELGFLAAAFYAAELILAPPFGALSDRLGHHRVMQWGPAFGGVAVVLTWATTHLLVLGGTRILEGASTAASVPSILGYIAAATSASVALRGRMVARFEAATLIGLGLGVVAAGPLYQWIGRTAFLLNACIYVVSFLIYRFGVEEEASPSEAAASRAEHPGLRRYWTVLTSSHVWLLAPTWVAINACLGIATNQTLFQLVKKPPPGYEDQFLMGRITPVLVSIGLAVGGLVFFAGLFYWGGRFKDTRRTTIILYGIVGGAVIAVATALLNHSEGQPLPLQAAYLAGIGAGLFVLAGATPAALGLLADISEAYPSDRGVIMGLYSVFLALGQIVGSLVGGLAAQLRGIDGLIVATIALLAIAVVPLSRLRAFEHIVGQQADGTPAASGEGAEGGPASWFGRRSGQKE